MPTYQPFLAEKTHTEGVDDATVAAAAGVPEAAITAYREGRPHWRLIENLRQVAAYMAVDHLELKARVDRAARPIIKGQVFTSAGRDTFAKLAKPTHIA